jgi:hypothetical protein
MGTVEQLYTNKMVVKISKARFIRSSLCLFECLIMAKNKKTKRNTKEIILCELLIKVELIIDIG